MSKRLHLCTKYDIEYGRSDFNYENEQVHYMLTSLNVSVHDSGEDVFFGDEIEVTREDIESAVRTLDNFIENNGERIDDELVDIDEVKDCLQNLFHNASFVADAEDLREILTAWLSDSPQDQDWIHLTWF